MDKRWFGDFRSFFGKKWNENEEKEENENTRQQDFEKHTPSQNSCQSFPLETEENRFEALFSSILENFPSWDIGTRVHVPEIPSFSYEFTPPDYSQRQSPADNLSNGKRRRSRDEFFSANDHSDCKEGKDYFHENPNDHIDNVRIFLSPSVPFFGHFDDRRAHNKYDDKRDYEHDDQFYSLFDRSFPFGEHSKSIDSLFGGILEEFEQMERQFFGDGTRGSPHVFDRDGPAKGREKNNPFDVFRHDEEHGRNLPPLTPPPRNKKDYDGSVDIGPLPPQQHQKIYARSYSSRSYTGPNGEQISETTKTDSSGKQTITTRRQRGNEIHTEVKERDEKSDEWRIVSNLLHGDKYSDETSNNPHGIIGEIFGNFFAGREKTQPTPQEIVWERPKVHDGEEEDGDQDYA